MANIAQDVRASFQEHVDENLLMDCMRCGFCLTSCPTYVHLESDEANSPRGRIALMKAVRDGFIDFDDSVKHSFDLCLGCRACEPACPAGVQYGSLIEQTREALHEALPSKGVSKVVENTVFKHLFVEQNNLSKVVGLVQFYQKSGLQKVTRKIGFMNLFPKNLQAMERALPAPPKKIAKAIPKKTSSLRVAFFAGCLMDTMFKNVNDKTIALLELAGVHVDVPDNQACCGALHGHTGQMKHGHQNVIQNVEAFDSDDYDYIVNNAGGCGAFLKEYALHLKNNPTYRDKAARFSNKQIDISSLLVKVGIVDLLKEAHPTSQAVVTYQDSCHLRNVNGVIEPPRELLKNIPGTTYVELPRANTCCGSAGIYNLVQPKMADAILATKMEDVQSVSPHYIITANPGCLMQMRAGIERENVSDRMEAVHIVDYVYDALHS